VPVGHTGTEACEVVPKRVTVKQEAHIPSVRGGSMSQIVTTELRKKSGQGNYLILFKRLSMFF